MTYKEVIKVLVKNNFNLVRKKGSHHIFKNNEGVITVVPTSKKELTIGTLRAIEKQTGIKF